MYLCRSVLCCGSPVSLCSVACRRKGAVREARAHQGISDEKALNAAANGSTPVTMATPRPSTAVAPRGSGCREGAVSTREHQRRP